MRSDVDGEFPALVDRLIARVAHWTPTRWKRPASDAAGSRADVVHGLAQRFADAAADAEGRVRRPVPRLDNDLALPDQIRVLADDVLAAAATATGSLATGDLATDVRAAAAALN